MEFQSTYLKDILAKGGQATLDQDTDMRVSEMRDFALVVEFGEGFRNVFEEEVVGGAAELMDVIDASTVVDSTDYLIDGEQGDDVGGTELVDAGAASLVDNDGVI